MIIFVSISDEIYITRILIWNWSEKFDLDSHADLSRLISPDIYIDLVFSHTLMRWISGQFEDVMLVEMASKQTLVCEITVPIPTKHTLTINDPEGNIFSWAFVTYKEAILINIVKF